MPVTGWWRTNANTEEPAPEGEREEVKEKSYYAGPLLVICALGISAYVIAK